LSSVKPHRRAECEAESSLHCRPAGLLRQIPELLRYLQNNADSIPDYARRYRAGERISTAFVESAGNQIIDNRMSKSQQMRWSPQGAHLLLQVTNKRARRTLA
jgi:hypothetical protein